ncbi:MAG TPA: 4Fe-4S binding protein [Treponema sp.]|nr:4Fe-4S binding protein [Treponema sp.]
MKRKIITIDEALCNGCGLCVSACHEGAIGLVDGKARLLRDDYCDGLGDCLPACPTNAISFEERVAAPYDEAAVQKNMAKQEESVIKAVSAKDTNSTAEIKSELRQWPVQLKLVPVSAPFFNGADLLFAADCAAFSRASFHQEFMQNRITVIGCPKLDSGSYIEKLTAILTENDIRSLTVVRMEVPCCGGLAYAALEAIKASGKFIPTQTIVLSTEGDIIRENN